jgi:hypothetical protein
MAYQILLVIIYKQKTFIYISNLVASFTMQGRVHFIITLHISSLCDQITQNFLYTHNTIILTKVFT